MIIFNSADLFDQGLNIWRNSIKTIKKFNTKLEYDNFYFIIQIFIIGKVKRVK
jgi:hypothetical protein